MNYEEFIQLVNSSLNTNYREDSIIKYGWNICSGDKESFEFSEAEQPFSALLDILEVTSPNITLLQYKRIENDLINSKVNRQSGWYGDFDFTCTRSIVLSELFSFLDAKNLL